VRDDSDQSLKEIKGIFKGWKSPLVRSRGRVQCWFLEEKQQRITG
jgi:hypothetical protein